jgi:integrase
MKHRLTDATVRKLDAPDRGNKIYYDTIVDGFGLRVTASGARSFILNYFVRSTRRERRITIGDIGTWSAVSAREHAKELKRDIDAGKDPLGKIEEERAAPTVSKLIDRYVDEHLGKKKPRSRIEDERLLPIIRDRLGIEKVSALTFADVDGLHRSVTKARGPFRANRVIALLSKMLSLSIKWGYRVDNPCRSVERNPEPKRTRYLSEKEIGRVMSALDAEMDQEGANIIRLLLLTGARSAEVLKMEWSQLDLTAGVWTKPHTLTKTAEEHRVPLSEEAVAVLSGIWRGAPAGKYVFGTFRPRKTFRHAWDRVRVAAGVPDVRPHDLRHSYASLLVNSGITLPVIGALLGHKTPATTQRYAHVNDGAMRAATKSVGKVIKMRGVSRRSR